MALPRASARTRNRTPKKWILVRAAGVEGESLPVRGSNVFLFGNTHKFAVRCGELRIAQTRVSGTAELYERTRGVFDRSRQIRVQAGAIDKLRLDVSGI